MNNVTKFTKTFTIGELNFTNGINRAMAVSAFKKYPQYYESILKNEDIKDALRENVKEKNNDIIEKEIEKQLDKILENNDVKKIISFVEIQTNIEKYSKIIVDDTLSQLLEYAGTDLPTNFNSYEEYAKYIISYCEENYVLYDYLEEETEITEKGFYSLVMEFITMGFTQGNTKNKGKLKITMN